MRRCSTDVEIEIIGRDGDEILTATIDFFCSPPTPGRRPDLNDPGYPPEPGEIEIIAVSSLRNGKGENLECPRWLNDLICRTADEDDLRDAVDWHDGPDTYDEAA